MSRLGASTATASKSDRKSSERICCAGGAAVDRFRGTTCLTIHRYSAACAPARILPTRRNVNRVLEWHYLHLYDPQITSPGSVMPSFKFLFELTDEEPRSTTDAVQLPEGYTEDKRWIVPSQRARELVGYLLSLDQKHALEDVQ